MNIICYFIPLFFQYAIYFFYSPRPWKLTTNTTLSRKRFILPDHGIKYSCSSRAPSLICNRDLISSVFTLVDLFCSSLNNLFLEIRTYLQLINKVSRFLIKLCSMNLCASLLAKYIQNFFSHAYQAALLMRLPHMGMSKQI